MFSSDNLRRVALPALALFIVNYICCVVFDSYFDWPSHIVYQAIVQFFALMSCHFLVFRRGKEQNHVWINYIVWMFIMNAGRIWVFYGSP